jgi:PAN domain-containing protein
MRHIRMIAMFAATLMLTVAAPAWADTVDDAYRDFSAGRYGPAFNTLFAYRVNHEGTLRVDFMLAVSGCRLSDGDFRALGGVLLAAIPNWYGPLRADQLADVQRQAQACPSTGISEQDAVSRVSGKSDISAKTLASERSQSGKDQALPPAPIVNPTMGPLVVGRVYLQADYRSAPVASAAECSALCDKEAKCMAMTFVIGQKLCWLKDKVPATADSPGYVSAVKLKKQP